MKVQNFKGWLNESTAPVPTTSIEDGLEIVQGLVDRGIDAKTAAALAGNMWQESRFDPAVRPESATYVGLIQWGDYKNQKTGPGARKTKLITKPNWKNRDVQLDYLKTELDGTYKGVANQIINAPTIQKAAEIVALKYEGTKSEIPTRVNAATQLYTAWQAKNPKAPAFDPAQIDQATDDSAWGEPKTSQQ
jgi:hypothetical protein